MLKPRTTTDDSVMPFVECRGKTCADGLPGTTVFDHCRYAGVVAEALYALLPKSVKFLYPVSPGLMVSLHDLGKVSPGFQGKYFMPVLSKFSPSWAKICQNMGANTNHAEVGAEALRVVFESQDKAPVIQAIAAHHGYRPQKIDMLSDRNAWQLERQKLIRALEQEFQHQISKGELEKGRADLLTGLMCVADWIASDEKYFPPDEAPLSADELSGRVRDVLQECGFRHTDIRSGLSFYDIFQFDLRPEQSTLISAVNTPRVYILEASMGSGKTEAALYAAYKLMASGSNHGLYFALPTRLTSDKIHTRVAAFMEKILVSPQAVKLAHGQAWLSEYARGNQDDGRLRTPAWFSPAKRGLLYPFSVGTIDQALLAVMNVKHSFVRLFGLAGKVVILDEVHSYDLYTGTILDSLVKTLRDSGCTVIILSATLTKSRRQKLLAADCGTDNGYPLVSGRPADAQLITTNLPKIDRKTKAVALSWLFGDAEVVVADALEQARKGCNVVCIANTVKKSQLWYRTLLAEMCAEDSNSVKQGLLHSRFPMFQREAIEDDWIEALGKGEMKRPTGSILIATQIVEQSVDIDADYMISELAPVDMLLQRMGRLWRHNRLNRRCEAPAFTVTLENEPSLNTQAEEKDFQNCTGPGSWYVYAPFVFLRTYELMIEREAVIIPSDIRFLLESIYDDSFQINESGLHQNLQRKMQGRQKELQARAISAGVNVTSLPIRSDDEENPPTRYNSRPTVSLLIVRDIDIAVAHHTVSLTLLNGEEVLVNQYIKNIEVTRTLYRNIVSVPKIGAFFEVEKDTRILQQHFFASEMPYICKLDRDGKSLLLYDTGKPLGWSYREDFGVCRPGCRCDRHADHPLGL